MERRELSAGVVAEVVQAMPRLRVRAVLAACLLTVVWPHGVTAAGAAADPWLNVKQCGASGSGYETPAKVTAGSNRIELRDIGDFRAGQQVMIQHADAHIEGVEDNGLDGNKDVKDIWLRGPSSPYTQKLRITGELDIRGFDGGNGDWLMYVLIIDGTRPTTFRWSDEMGHRWNATEVRATGDWQLLNNGLEVRLNPKTEWQLGHLVEFVARTQMNTEITRVEGNSVWLKDTPNLTRADTVIRHRDEEPLQRAVEQAIAEKRHLYFPPGHYRLCKGLTVVNAASLRIEGSAAEHVLLDISQGTGPILDLQDGTEVTVRNLRMIGHGSKEQPMRGLTKLPKGVAYRYWTSKSCRAMFIQRTERVLVENVHAERMANEAFYSAASCRSGLGEPRHYTKSLTFLRCSVTNSAHNAFNNNDTGENTSVLYCRIVDCGAYAYEGPGKFVRFIGNYVKNASCVVGNMDGRPEHLARLGCGQAIIRDNVFEGGGVMRGAISVTRGASQVAISNNLFVNFNGDAIAVYDWYPRGGPQGNIVVSGNIIDLTCVDGKERQRTGVKVNASDTIVADNQIYVRGDQPAQTTGIWIMGPAVGVTVHDNLIRNCGKGLLTKPAGGNVAEVLGPTAFLRGGEELPLPWSYGHGYRGWHLAWLSGQHAGRTSTLAGFDQKDLAFHLTAPHKLAVGDRFHAFPDMQNLNIHDNQIVDCREPVQLADYGSPTSWFRDNIVTRGAASGVKAAIEMHGMYKLTGNHISGFDEKDSSALSLAADPLERTAQSVYRGNTFERCTRVVPELQKPLWEAAKKQENVFVDCGPDKAGSPRP